MRRQRTAAAIALILGLVAAGACSKGETSPPSRVRILVTTDEHSHLLAVAPERDEWPLATTAGTGTLKGGVARRGTVIDREKADGVPTVLLSNGDFSQGALSAVAFTKANFDVILMRLLGYDAIALGNHEFDSLPAGLAASIDAAKSKGGAPPFVLTNALNTAGTAIDAMYGGVGSGKDIVKGLIIDKRGLKVGVVSALGPSAAYDGQYTAAPVTFSEANLKAAYPTYIGTATASIAGILQPVIDELRADGAQVVVLLFHGGLASTASNGDVDLIVPRLSGVDLVVAGHTHGAPDATALLTDKASRKVPVVQPAPFGDEVARVEFTVVDGAVSYDAARTAYLKVDDRILPTSNQEVRAGLSTAISSIEAQVLPLTLQAVTGSVIVDNPVEAGDLYFYPVGKTTFDLIGENRRAETNGLNLDADALLAVSNALGFTAQVSLQNAGSIRGDLVQGATGTLAFSDVYRMVSLGADPWEQSPGYPLVRAYIPLGELWGAFEQTLQMSYANNDYYLGASGVTFDWDPSLTPFNPASPAPGWIKKLTIGGTTYFDVSLNPVSGWLVDPTPIRIPVVTTLLVASFASNVGVHLFASADTVGDTTPVADLSTLIVKWPTTAHVKDHQALARYIAGLPNGGELPAALYDLTMPVRAKCSRATATNPTNVTYPCPFP